MKATYLDFFTAQKNVSRACLSMQNSVPQHYDFMAVLQQVAAQVVVKLFLMVQISDTLVLRCDCKTLMQAPAINKHCLNVVGYLLV